MQVHNLRIIQESTRKIDHLEHIIMALGLKRKKKKTVTRKEDDEVEAEEGNVNVRNSTQLLSKCTQSKSINEAN